MSLFFIINLDKITLEWAPKFSSFIKNLLLIEFFLNLSKNLTAYSGKYSILLS